MLIRKNGTSKKTAADTLLVIMIMINYLFSYINHNPNFSFTALSKQQNKRKKTPKETEDTTVTSVLDVSQTIVKPLFQPNSMLLGLYRDAKLNSSFAPSGSLTW
jgi:hypothetical protein